MNMTLIVIIGIAGLVVVGMLFLLGVLIHGFGGRSPNTCPDCRSRNRVGARYCGQCGRRLSVHQGSSGGQS